MHIIINAGGSGTRLWPLSTKEGPKQFIGLIDEESLLIKTFNRLRDTFAIDQIWINTNQQYFNLVKTLLPPDFPESHILLEPEKRDSFAAIIAHAAVVAHHVGSNVPLVFLASDHFIPTRDNQIFNATLARMGWAVSQRQFDLVVAGVKPTKPDTQLGYIQVNSQNQHQLFEDVVKVQLFKEKPNLETATEYFESGNFLWNLGYFGFAFDDIFRLVTRFWPDVAPVLEEIFHSGSITPELFTKIPKIAIDYALVEKAQNIGVVGMNIAWEDIGNWAVVKHHLPDISNQELFLEIAGSGNAVKVTQKSRKVAFVGVSGLLLVESEEGILVIDPKYSAETKKVAEYFEQKSQRMD